MRAKQSASIQLVYEIYRFVAEPCDAPRGVTAMRSSNFNRYDRELIYYRAGPARRTAIGLAILFLLSLAAFAAFTTARAAEGEEEADPIAAGTLVLHPRGGGGDLPAVRLHHECARCWFDHQPPVG